MGDEAWRPTRWTAEQLEERRLAAAVLLRNGRLSQAAIGRRLRGQPGKCLPLGGHVGEGRAARVASAAADWPTWASGRGGLDAAGPPAGTRGDGGWL